MNRDSLYAQVLDLARRQIDKNLALALPTAENIARVGSTTITVSPEVYVRCHSREAIAEARVWIDIERWLLEVSAPELEAENAESCTVAALLSNHGDTCLLRVAPRTGHCDCGLERCAT